MSSRGQRDEAARAAAPEAAAALHGAFPRRNAKLHRAGSPPEAGLHPDLRLVVRGGHSVRDDHRTTAVLRRDHGWNSGQGETKDLASDTKLGSYIAAIVS